MDCPECNVRIADTEELMFYVKGEKDVHLTIKPEDEAIFNNKKIVNQRKDNNEFKIACSACKADLGKKIPFGPKGRLIIAFSAKKVILLGEHYKKEKWFDVYNYLKIELRDKTNYHKSVESNEKKKKFKPKRFDEPVNFAATEKLKDFEWLTVSIKNEPRNYQKEAFIKALQYDLIVVMDTGTGKTLVASMVLAKMQQLNPERMGLMIVERVPLVFQQQQAIEADTNLMVLGVCGSNKTVKMVQDLNAKKYDILVITAGAFLEMIYNKYLDVSFFSVIIFDECHHMSKGHVYVKVLDLFKSLPKKQQPRIVGLTASPIQGSSIDIAERKLDELFKVHFNNALMHSLQHADPDQKTEDVLIETSPEEEEFIHYLCLKVNDHLRNISKSVQGCKVTSLSKDISNIDVVRGDINGLKCEQTVDKDQLKTVSALINSILLCNYFGVPSGTKNLDGDSLFEDICEKFKSFDQISMRLQKLFEILRNASEESKIIIFVHRRFVLDALHQLIQKEFPSFNASWVVGHDGMKGMDHQEQNNVMRRFHSGETKLLISTSVIEEGIDVPACDLVITFAGFQSLIQHIQRRGRARKDDSRFLVFQTKEEKMNIQSQEKIMRKVVRKLEERQHLFNDMSKDIMDSIERSISTHVKDFATNMDLSIMDTSEKDLAFNLYVIRQNTNAQIIENYLKDMLSTNDDFELKRFEKVEDSTYYNIFSSDVLTFVAYVSPKSLGSTSYIELFRIICKNFEFKLYIEEKIHHIWATIRRNDLKDLNQNQKLHLKKFSLGRFEDETSVTIFEEFDHEDCQLIFNLNHSIELLIPSTNEKIEISLSSLQTFSFYQQNKDECLLFMNLIEAPFFSKGNERRYKKKKDKKDRRKEPYFAKYPLLVLSFNVNDYALLNQILKSPKLFQPIVLYTKLNFLKPKKQKEFIQTNVPWSLQCVIDSRNICFPPSMLDKIMVDITSFSQDSENSLQLCEGILKIMAEKKHPYFVKFDEEFRQHFHYYKDIQINDVIPTDNFLVKRVLITPIRKIRLPQTLVASNRFLERFNDRVSDILIVSFCDENTAKLHKKELLPRYRDILQQHLKIENKKYRYFLSTASQMRDHKCYFLQAETYKEICDLRETYFIQQPNEKFKSVAKYLSRLGMYGTSAKYVFDISKKDVINNAEDMFAEDGDKTTDGAGLISYTKASEIAKVLELDEVPSAFQIRYSGAKGMVVTTKNDDSQLQGKHLLLRESMVKFDNEDMRFCIARYAKYNNVYLNKEIINLLTSIPKEEHNIRTTLVDYLEKSLGKVANIFEKRENAREALANYLPEDEISKIYNSGFDFADHYHWCEVLQGIYRLRTKDLKSRLNIPIKDGCLLLGVPDPCKVLKDNEIFVQIRKEDSESSEIIKSLAIIYRNPCLHPGDFRRVQCVDKEELRHLFNVVVFPAYDCKTSLAASCSGGDLDGDMYSVIWDDNLVPSDDFEPLRYSKLSESKESKESKKSTPKDERIDVTDAQEIAEFFVKFMRNDALGRIAHRHLALSDIQPKGARDELAIELAKCQAQAVDYPKTGIEPNVPEEALNIVKSKGFPDFMEKKFENSYQSERDMGHFYRYCKDRTFEFDPDMKIYRNIRDDLEVIIRDEDMQGYEKYIDEAKKIYRLYKYHVDMLMVKFSLKCEIDAILAFATYGWNVQFEQKKGKVSETIKEWYNNIKGEIFKLFHENCETSEEKLKKAYAWYQIICNQKSDLIKSEKKDDNIYLGFPWIIYIYLCQIRELQKTSKTSKMNSLIGRSSVNLFKKKFYRSLLKDFNQRLAIVQHTHDTINNFNSKKFKLPFSFTAQMYGSSSLFVCEPESDIDICVLPHPDVYENENIVSKKEEFLKTLESEQHKQLLDIAISEAVDTIAHHNTPYLEAKVPFIKFQYGNEKDDNMSCDISMNSSGLKKTYYFRHLFKDWKYFLIFWSLVKWSRSADLIRQYAAGDKCVLDTADFYALILHVLKLPTIQTLDIQDQSKLQPLSKIYKQMIEGFLRKDQKGKMEVKEKFHFIGQEIMNFFRQVSQMKDELTIKWPIDGVREVTINEKAMLSISSQASKAYHVLLATKDFDLLREYFLSSHGVKGFKKNLSLSLSFAVGKAKEFHSQLLQFNTGASVRIDSIQGMNNYCINAEGTSLQLEKLKEEIRKLCGSNRALVLGRLPVHRSRYFMVGSSKIFSMQDTSSDSRVKFECFTGHCDLLHEMRERHSIILDEIEEEEEEQKKKLEMQKFKKHIEEQMAQFPSKNKQLKDTLQVTARFGSFYVIDINSTLPDGVNHIQFQELQMALDKRSSTRKNFEREGFSSLNSGNNFDGDTKSEGFGSSNSNKKGELAEHIKKEKDKMKRRRAGISSAFVPGLTRINPKAKDMLTQNKLKAIYVNALEKCGFQKGECFDRKPAVWKISMTLTSSFEVEILLDENKKIVKLWERALNWVHDTVVTGKQQNIRGGIQCTPDMRFLITTNEEINDDMREKALQINEDGTIDLPIIFKDNDIPHKKKADKFIGNVRHVEDYLKYTNGFIDGCIAIGTNYKLATIDQDRAFCELSLYMKPDELLKSINNSLDDHSLESFSNELFERSLEIEKALGEFLNESIED